MLIYFHRQSELYMKETSTTSLNNVIGCIFKHLRNERCVEQDLVALKLGLSVSTISKIELGNVSITVESIYRLCELFGIEMLDFFIYLENAKNFLATKGVKVYVDKSMSVKEVDKRAVSYEIEKKYDGIGDIILPPTAIDITKLIDMDRLDEILEEEGLSEEVKVKSFKTDSKNQPTQAVVDISEKKIQEDTEIYTLPQLHIKQLYVLLEEFFESNPVALSPSTQEFIEELYSAAKNNTNIT